MNSITGAFCLFMISCASDAQPIEARTSLMLNLIIKDILVNKDLAAIRKELSDPASTKIVLIKSGNNDPKWPPFYTPCQPKFQWCYLHEDRFWKSSKRYFIGIRLDRNDFSDSLPGVGSEVVVTVLSGGDHSLPDSMREGVSIYYRVKLTAGKLKIKAIRFEGQ